MVAVQRGDNKIACTKKIGPESVQDPRKSKPEKLTGRPLRERFSHVYISKSAKWEFVDSKTKLTKIATFDWLYL